MAFDFDPGALLGHFYSLQGGFRVSLRMARSSDLAPIRDLLARRDEAEGLSEAPARSFEVARLVSFDPRREIVLCATALVDGGERLVGVGSIDLEHAAEATEPRLVVIDPEAPESLSTLLTGALIGRAGALVRARAA